jgi:hypothetical protein
VILDADCRLLHPDYARAQLTYRFSLSSVIIFKLYTNCGSGINAVRGSCKALPTNAVASSQYHHAVAGGWVIRSSSQRISGIQAEIRANPTHYREVVLTSCHCNEMRCQPSIMVMLVN